MKRFLRSCYQYTIAFQNTFWLLWRTLYIWPFSKWVEFWTKYNNPVYIGGLKFFIRNQHLRDKIIDCYMVFSCVQERQYTPSGYELRSGQTFIDIGGHIGSFALFAATEVGQSGCVIVYESALDNFSQLKQNIDVNSLFNIKTFPYCVAASRGERMFYKNHLNSAMHGLYQKSLNAAAVYAVTLEDIFATRYKH